MSGIAITSLGAYVPKAILTNEELADKVPGLTVPKIERNGMSIRHISGPEEGAADMMANAGFDALGNAGLTIDDIDLMVGSYTFPDKGSDCPRTCEIWKQKMGAGVKTLAVQESAACAGFPWALERAVMEMHRHNYRKALVISGDKVTPWVNYQDYKTSFLFGDASAGLTLEMREDWQDDDLIDTIRLNDTNYLGVIEIPAGGGLRPAIAETVAQNEHFMVMPGGKEMLEIITNFYFPETCKEICRRNGLSLSDIRWIVPHQANIRLIEPAQKELRGYGLREGAVFIDNIHDYANTSGSSVPLALYTLYKKGLLQEGDLVILIGFGAGIDIGASLIRWSLRR